MDTSASDTSSHSVRPRGKPRPRAGGTSVMEGFDASMFKQANRLHVQDHALFTYDHHLVINPEEVMPENEPQLISKVLRHYSASQPSFVQSGPSARAHMVGILAALTPVSLAARKAVLEQQQKTLAEDEKKGPGTTSYSGHEHGPMTYYISESARSDDELPADVKEQLANGIASYLLLQEALVAKGYARELASYLPAGQHTARTLDIIAGTLGVSADDITRSMARDGVPGLAALLNIPDSTRNQIATLVSQASEQGFSANLIENWAAGHRIEAMKNQPLAEVIETGKLARTSALIESARHTLSAPQLQGNGHNAIEDRLVAMLRDMPVPLQQALFLSGTEISATPSYQIGNLIGFAHSALGQHWFLPMQRGTNEGVRHIYLTAANNVEHISKVLAHEAHHLVFPQNFSKNDLAAMDQLLIEGSQHIRRLNDLCQAWLAGDANERISVAAQIDEEFATQGTSLDKALGGSFSEAAMHRMVRAVDLAHRDIDVHGSDLKLFYPDPQSRAAEMVSRFAAIKHVVLRDVPDMLQLIAPQMETLYQRYYIPHLEKAVAQMQQDSGKESQNASPSQRMVQMASGQMGNIPDAPGSQIQLPTMQHERMTEPSEHTMATLHDAGFADRLAAEKAMAGTEQHTAR